MKRFLLLMFFSLIFVGYKIFAQNIVQLTIEKAIKMGLENSKNLKIAESKIRFSDAKTEEANRLMLPTLNLAGGYTRLSQVEPFKINFQGRDFEISPTILNTYQTRLGLQYPLFTGFRLENNYKINEKVLYAAREDYRSEVNNLIFNIKNAYWNIKIAEMMLQSTQENIRQLEAHLLDLENFQKNGLAIENDLLKVKVQIANLKVMKLDFENNIKLGKINLAILIGIPSDSEIELLSEIDTNIIDFEPLEKLLQIANKNRPELQAVKYRKEASLVGISLARSGWFPQINFFANYYFNRPNQRLMPAQDKFYGTWDIGLQFSYNIWNWMTTKYQTQQAEETFQQTQLGEDQLREAINLEVTQNYFAFKKTVEKIELAKLSVRQAEENYRVTLGKFKQGLVTSSELLDAEVSLLNSKISMQTSYLEYIINKSKLEKAIFVK
ncbi:MAG: TolC family protein [Candidatus Kapaibacteriales bacterium]